MARHRCPGRRQRLIHWTRDNLQGPFFTNTGQACIKTVGNFRGVGKPGSGPRAIFGIVLDETTIQIRFSLCVNVGLNTGIQYQIDGGTWTTVSGSLKISDTLYNFTTGTINPGEDVRWRYVGGSGTILDCAEAADIGDQEIPVENPLVLAGNFILLETGGMNIFLLEDDIDQSSGLKTEDAAP